MMINSVQKNNPNFTSMHLHSADLRRFENGVETDTVKAIISKINPADKKDAAALKEIREAWEKISRLAGIYFKEFFRYPGSLKAEYYAVETPITPKKNKIVGLMSIMPVGNGKLHDLYISYLLPDPRIMQERSITKVKGISEVLLGESFQRAKETRAVNLDFMSTASENDFYHKTLRKAGIAVEKGNPDEPMGVFCIQNGDFGKYLKYCREKFGFRPVNQS